MDDSHQSAMRKKKHCKQRIVYNSVTVRSVKLRLQRVILHLVTSQSVNKTEKHSKVKQPILPTNAHTPKEKRKKGNRGQLVTTRFSCV